MNINKSIEKELDRLAGIKVPQSKDIDLVFSLYKTFVDSEAPFYTTGCSCKNSIENYYKKLMSWWSEQKLIGLEVIDDTKLYNVDDFFDENNIKNGRED